MLAYHYPPHTEIGAARPHRLARYLRQAGWDVLVVASSAHLNRAADLRALADSTEPGISRVPRPHTPWPHRWASILSGFERWLLPCKDRLGWLPHAYAAAREGLSDHSILISTHPPVVTHLTALLLKLRTGRPWVADFRDPLWGNPSRVARRCGWMDPVIERLIVRHADAVIANTDAAGSLLRARYPSRAHAIAVIYNGFEPDDVITPDAAVPGPLRTLSHVGTLYGARTPEPLLASLARLIADGRIARNRWQFRQVGRARPGSMPPPPPEVPTYQTGRHLPQTEARREMVAADVLVLLDMNHRHAGLQVPAKLFEYVRTGRPILAFTPAGSGTAQILEIAAVPHVCIDPACPPAVLDAALATFLTTAHPVKAPSPAFMATFRADQQVRELIAILDPLVRVPLARSPPDGQYGADRRQSCAD